MKKYDYFNGTEWEKVDYDFLRGVDDIENLEECYMECSRLRVEYKNGKTVYYQNIHGSWGFPTVFK